MGQRTAMLLVGEVLCSYEQQTKIFQLAVADVDVTLVTQDNSAGSGRDRDCKGRPARSHQVHDYCRPPATRHENVDSRA